MHTFKDIQKRRKLVIKIVNVIGLLSLFSFTITAFAWGTGEAIVYYLLLYPVLFITTILLIANVRFAYFVTIILALIYATLLNHQIGKLFVFDNHNYILYLVLALPYFTMLILVPLTTSYLTATSKHQNLLFKAAMIIAISFPIFAIAERYDTNYLNNIFIDAKINSHGQVMLRCNPSFADSRTFIVTTNSSKIADQIKKYGEFYQGSFFMHNSTVKMNYRFSNLKSITLIKVGNNQIVPAASWPINEVKGDVSFLTP